MSNKLNGIDVAALQEFAQGVAEAKNAAKRSARFNVKTQWEHQARSVATVSRYSLSGVEYAQVPGLVSKVWIKQSKIGAYGGMYFWASKGDYENYLESELYKAVSTHPNLINFNTDCYEDMPEGTSVTAGVCRF